MMVPFTSMVIWTFQEKVGSSWKKILWYSGMIAFIFSINIEMLSVKLSDEKCDKWYRCFYYNLRLQMQEYYQHKAVIMDSCWNHHMERCYGEADEV